jgi:hypothetical protein
MHKEKPSLTNKNQARNKEILRRRRKLLEKLVGQSITVDLGAGSIVEGILYKSEAGYKLKGDNKHVIYTRGVIRINTTDKFIRFDNSYLNDKPRKPRNEGGNEFIDGNQVHPGVTVLTDKQPLEFKGDRRTYYAAPKIKKDYYGSPFKEQ